MNITAGNLIALFDRMYREHWSYVWGAAREGCVDCSGAFVWAYKQYGQSIYHGSNAIARNYTRGLLPVARAAPGMAAFKLRKPGAANYALPARYQGSGDLNDYYHIGLVDESGEYVLNAKSVSAGFSRDPLSKWHAVAELSAVAYSEKEAVPMETMIVTCTPGEKVNLRQRPTTSSTYIDRIPNGTAVQAGPPEDGWRAVVYNGKKGWMLDAFLRPEAAPADGMDGEMAARLNTLKVALETALDALNDVLGGEAV